MEQTVVQARCPNCGTEFASPAIESGQQSEVLRCPVCQFEFVIEAPDKRQAPTSTAELARAMSDLIRQARATQTPDTQIIETLRSELAFQAELANPGRRMWVQIIDLGARDSQTGATQESDQRDLIHSRQFLS